VIGAVDLWQEKESGIFSHRQEFEDIRSQSYFNNDDQTEKWTRSLFRLDDSFGTPSGEQLQPCKRKVVITRRGLRFDNG
jgi:hypothetical protein